MPDSFLMASLGAGTGHSAFKGGTLRGPEDKHQTLFALLDLLGCIIESIEIVPVWQHLDKGGLWVIHSLPCITSWHLCLPPG